jgi:two-component system, response regulator
LTGPEIEILLVEDDPADAELALTALRAQSVGNRIVHVQDGAEALDCLFARGAYAGRRPEQPRIVLLDLNLPKVSGLDVLRRIKADVRTNATPVIVLTATPFDRELVQNYNLGVEGYIVKPVDFTKLARAVEGLGLTWVLVGRGKAA